MRILIVEDDPIIGFAAEEILIGAGHQVVGPADSVEEAVRHAAEEGVDFAMVDINLAGHDEGIELARELMRRFGIVSVFVSGQTSAARANSHLALGLLRKPYDARSLLAVVPVMERLLAGMTPPPPAIPASFELFARPGGSALHG